VSGLKTPTTELEGDEALLRAALRETRVAPLRPAQSAAGSVGRVDSRAGDYDLERVIGEGGCGTVHLGVHRTSGARVAIKLLRADLALVPDMLRRFLREAQIVSRIRHPGIVAVHGLGHQADGTPFIVMELCEGVDLGHRLRGPMAPREALHLLSQVADALQAAHEVGVVHRDLKAANIIVLEGAEPARIKLTDFGIAKLLESDSDGQTTSVGRVLGTPHCMAPEQVRAGSVDARTDVYALGVLAFQLLTGRYPFEAPDPLEVERLQLFAPPPRPSAIMPTVPSELDDVVVRCLEKQPGRRYPTALHLRDALRAIDAPPATAGRTAVMGLLFEGRPRRGGTMGEADLANVVAAAERAALELERRGFLLACQTATLVLAVRPISSPDTRADRRAAIDLARDLYRVLVELPAPGSAVELTLLGFVDQVAMAGGQVLTVNPTPWSQRAVEGICATPEMVAGLDAAGLTVV
jgi:serine/threonine-protein kinase